MSATRASAQASIPANAQNRYEVSIEDLPLSCPMPAMSLWNSHPRTEHRSEKAVWNSYPSSAPQ